LALDDRRFGERLGHGLGAFFDAIHLCLGGRHRDALLEIPIVGFALLRASNRLVRIGHLAENHFHLGFERPEAFSKVRVRMEDLREREICFTNLAPIRVPRNPEELVVIQLVGAMEGLDDLLLKPFIDLHIFHELYFRRRAGNLATDPFDDPQGGQSFD
jgi:hypothetical protein